MKETAGVLRRHLPWMIGGFTLALVAEIVWILRAIDRGAGVTQTTLALIALTAFAVVGLVDRLARREPKRPRSEVATPQHEFRTAA